MIKLEYAGTNGTFRSPQKDQALNLDGAQNFIIRARIMRTAGSGWQGDLFWHGASKEDPVIIYKEDNSREKHIPKPADLDNKFVIVEWDMRDVDKWQDCIIDQIRIDFESTAGSIIYVDWVEIGGKVTARYKDGVLKFPLRTEESAKRIKGTWAKIKYKAKTTDKFNIFAILAKYRETF